MKSKNGSFLTRLTALAGCLFLLAALAFGQSQANSGDIEGRVVDQNGAAIPNAALTAKNQATGIAKNTTADSGGNFRFVLLQPGSYTVTATANGFAQAELTNITVSIGGAANLEVRLSAGGANVTVDVSAEGQTVETSRTSVSTTVNQRAIENLPINGRNFQDFATLTPGVIRDQTRGGDLSIGGQKGTLNSLQVDGVDNNNTFFGQSTGRTGVRPPYQFSEEAVQEFQVNQNGFSAEFGRAGGAVINVITKSGANEFHGGAFEYFRDEALNANDPAFKVSRTPAGVLRANIRPKSQINQFGGRLGGPIVKNRAFFFFTFDGQRQTLPNIVDVPNLGLQPAATQALLAPKLNAYSIPRNQQVYLGKFDVAINQSNQLSVRFNQQNFTGRNNENGGILSAEEHSGDSIVKSTTLSGTLASTLSSNLVNEFRFQFARDKEPGRANSADPEAVIATGGGNLSIGRNNFSPRETTIKRAQFVDNMSYTRGRNNFKFGVDINIDRIFNFFPGLFSGSYTFNNTTAPGFGFALFANNFNTALAPSATAYTQAFPGANTSGGTTNPNSRELAYFAQDDVRVSPKLTLNLGVRYDYQRLACPPAKNSDLLFLRPGLDTSACPDDKNNFAPRAGFSYAPDEKTVIRGGYGLFYGRTTAITLGTAHSNNGINVISITLSAAQIQAANLRFPNRLTALPTGNTTRNLFLFDKDYVQPYVQQGRLGIEREILPGLSLSATYLFFRGVHLTRSRDVNLPTPVATTATVTGGPAFSFNRFGARPLIRASGISYGRITLFESSGTSRYDGLALQAAQRFRRGLQFIAAYTYSKAKDDKPDSTAVVLGADDSKYVENNLNTRADYDAGDTDLRHRFVFSPIYETGKYESDNAFLRALLSDYTFSGIAQLQSGFAYSAIVGNDPNNDGNRNTDRLPGSARNGFNTPSTYQFDTRVTRALRLSENTRLRFIFEAFNIFNRTNVLTVNNTFYNFGGAAATGFTLTAPTAATAFGTPRSFLPPRQLQLAVKFDF